METKFKIAKLFAEALNAAYYHDDYSLLKFFVKGFEFKRGEVTDAIDADYALTLKSERERIIIEFDDEYRAIHAISLQGEQPPSTIKQLVSITNFHEDYSNHIDLSTKKGEAIVEAIDKFIAENGIQEWKQIDDTDVEVSNLGNIRKKAKNEYGYREIPLQTHNGFKYVFIRQEGAYKSISVAKLVAKYFIPNPHNYERVISVNGDRSDVRACNLKWVSNEEKRVHYKKFHKCYNDKEICVTNGETVFTCYEDIYTLVKSEHKYRNALRNNVISAVKHCLSGKRKNAYGYAWTEADKKVLDSENAMQ